jgi:hypothetical protein
VRAKFSLKEHEMDIDSLERKILRQIWRPIREIGRYSDEVHRLYG